MFGSENLKTLSFIIDVDPGATDKYFHLMKAPRELTVKAVYAVSTQTQNAGTAILARLENWGTAGTGVKTGGTIMSSYLGGTAASAVLTANTPAAGTIDTNYDNVLASEWLVLHYAEQGAGFISGDRLAFHVHYVDGLGA